jgi:hypothetical protein
VKDAASQSVWHHLQAVPSSTVQHRAGRPSDISRACVSRPQSPKAQQIISSIGE